MKDVDVIGEYTNGNTHVTIKNDGTKIRSFDGDIAISDYPETIDVNVSYRCNGRCEFCYQNSTIDGPVADLDSDQVLQWLDSIPAYTELALNCNDPTDPMFERFLINCRSRKLIANITVNQLHFIRHFDIIHRWSQANEKLVYGVGVSVSGVNDTLLGMLQSIPNLVVHTIVGATSPKVFYKLADHDLAVLVLGYKDLGRGKNYHVIKNDLIDYNTRWLYRNIDRFVGRFKVLSFDNLALKQLNVRRFVPNWNSVFMGKDGSHSMYVDLVNKQFSVSSLTSETERFGVPKDWNIRTMFNVVKEASNAQPG